MMDFGFIKKIDLIRTLNALDRLFAHLAYCYRSGGNRWILSVY